MVGRAGFEPAKAYASGVTVRPIWPLWNRPLCIECAGARRGTRTPDQLFTKQLLYQLSYAGELNTLPDDSDGNYTTALQACQTGSVRISRVALLFVNSRSDWN